VTVTTTPSPTLARIERLSREELLGVQFRKLKRQLERVHATNGFYRERMRAAAVAPEDIRSLEDFRRRVPIVTKYDFLKDQEENPPFGQRLGVPREEVVMVNLTGGTSGIGQEAYGRTNADVALQGHLHWLPWFIAGLRKGDMAFNCVPSGGMTTGGWGPAEGFRLAGATAFHVGGTLSTQAIVDIMCRFGAIHFMYASTNYVHTLTEACKRQGVLPRERFPMLKAIYFAAEGYPIEWADTLEEFWGCDLREGYGSTQAHGFAYTTCEAGIVRGAGERGLLHGFEWHHVLEIINPDTGEPAQPGEEGEVILTNLDAQGSPVIRFSTRDKARYFPHSACTCGRAWDCIEAGTVSRYDDMMKIKGNNVWPSAVDMAIFAFPEVAEYAGRVFVDDAGRTDVLIRLALRSEAAAASAEAKAALLAQISERLKDRTNVQMKLVEVPRAELPEFTYKARRWTDERQKGYAERL
jgi:phenylacetate-CoA ligase